LEAYRAADRFFIPWLWMGIMPTRDNEVTSKAVQEYRAGKGISFMTKDLSAILRPVCFGGRKSHGNKIWLHSHLSKYLQGIIQEQETLD
jgi:hypothetical protein